MMRLFQASPKNAALFAVLCAASLALSKLVLFFLTGSFLIALSAWDSGMDMIVSFINRIIIKYARLNPDHNHPYGHGRAESIAALGQGALIIGGAVIIAISSIKHGIEFFKNQEALQNLFSIWIVLFFLLAALLSYFITYFLIQSGEKHNSPALLADAEHYHTDAIINLGTAISILLIMYFQIPLIDPILAFLFALYISYKALLLIIKSIHELMDHDISEPIKERAKNIILGADSRIIDVHRLRGRKSGHCYLFDCHVTLPDDLSFQETHLIIETIEKILRDEFGGDAVAHADPSSARYPI